MNASIWNLRPLPRAAVTRTFTDAEQPDWPGVTLSLRPMDGVTGTRYATLKARLMVEHVTGLRGPDGELVRGADGEPIQPPVPVNCQDFSKRFPDEFVVDRYAKLVAMWAGEGEDPTPLSEVIGWQALLYEGWFEIANWIEELFRTEAEKGGSRQPSSPAAPPAPEGAPATSRAQQGPLTSDSSAPSPSDTGSTRRSPLAATPMTASGTGSSPPSNGGSGSSPDSSEEKKEPQIAVFPEATLARTWY